MTWEWLPAAFAFAVVAFLVWKFIDRQRADDGDGLLAQVAPLAIPGLGAVQYGRAGMTRTQAEGMALRLRRIKDRLWPRLQRLYGIDAAYFMDTITLDRNYRHDGKDAVVKLYRRAGKMFLRPQGGQGHDAYFWFALELHNLYRGWALGMDRYLPSTGGDKQKYDEAVRLCKAVAAGG